MRKILTIMTLAILLISGCSNGKMEFVIEKEPDYKNGVESEFILKVTESGEAVTGATIVATLEMAKMDHGTIEVFFDENGNGTYTGVVELPMAGEWIADINAEKDGKTHEGILTFDVKER